MKKMSKKIKNLKKIKSETFQRSFEIRMDGIDEKERTVPLSFSSEDQYQRWFGYEILDHEQDSVDLSRLNNSAPILSDHDHRIQIGVVVKGTATIDQDKKGRLIAKFGSSKKAKQEFRDVMDGIRTKVSVGYRVHEMVLDGKKDEIEIYRVTKWQPFEVSLVSIPADDTVGIGKSAENSINLIKIKGNSKMTEEEKAAKALKERNAAENLEQLKKDARTSELGRIRSINTLVETFTEKGYDLKGVTMEHLEKGSSFEEAKIAILEEVVKGQSAQRQDLDLDLNMSEKEAKEYSLFNAIDAHISGNWKKAGFELECSQEIAIRAKKEARGIFVPPEIQMRAQNVGTATAGGNLVGTDHNASSFIEMLRDNSVLQRLGATNLHGLVGDQDIPNQTGASQAYWLAEGGDVTDSAIALGMLNMAPKTIATQVSMTRRSLKQSNPSVEALAWRDMAQVMALGIDIAGLQGDGTGNTPVGITNTAGVSVQTIAAAAGTGAPTWAELVGFETALAADNNLDGSLGFVTTAAIRGLLKTTLKDAGSGLFLMDGNDANGYPVTLKNSQTAKQIIFGKFSDVLIGHWGLLDVMPDEAALAASAGLVVRLFQDLDILVRRPESFCING